MQLKPKKQNNRQEIAFLKDMIYQLADQVDALNTALVCMSIIHGTDPAKLDKVTAKQYQKHVKDVVHPIVRKGMDYTTELVKELEEKSNGSAE